MEKPFIDATSPRCARAVWSAFCQESASTKSDSLSLLPSELTSTSQRTRDTYQPDVGAVNASDMGLTPLSSRRQAAAGPHRPPGES